MPVKLKKPLQSVTASFEKEKAATYDTLTASGKELFDIAFGLPDDPGTPLTLDEINRELTARRTEVMPYDETSTHLSG
jgi:hypothetical protein